VNKQRGSFPSLRLPSLVPCHLPRSAERGTAGEEPKGRHKVAAVAEVAPDGIPGQQQNGSGQRKVG